MRIGWLRPTTKPMLDHSDCRFSVSCSLYRVPIALLAAAHAALADRTGASAAATTA